MPEKVVITGLGAICSIGLSAEDAWKNALAGVSGVAPLTQFDSSESFIHIACEVKNFDPENYMSGKEARRRDRFQQFSTIVAAEAMKQSGLEITPENAGRIGVIFSSAIGGLHAIIDNEHIRMTEGPRRVNPFTITMVMSNGAAGLISIDYGTKGPAFSIASACASGADAIGTAWMLIRNGVVDAAITGASEATINPFGFACFDRLGAMSRRNSDYSMTPQPFDKNRDGLVMGEGGGCLILESESHARQRSAIILAELAGYASNADAFHITAPSEDGAGGASAIRIALEHAGTNFDQVDYINAHGTATQLNDLSETKAIKKALGQYAYTTPVSSTKSMTGHMMGATGALEAVFCTLAIRDGAIPPTIHYQTPDPELDLDYVPNSARQLNVKTVVSNAFGFGGHNAVLVFKKYTG